MLLLRLSLFASVLLYGCADPPEPFDIQLVTVPVLEQGTCRRATEGLTSELSRSTFTLRFTFLRPTSEKVGHRSVRRRDLACYGVVAPKDSLELMLPSDMGSRLGLYVEAFRQGNLELTGFAPEIDLQSTDARVLMHKAMAQSCGYRARSARAFHTATLLPNGKVLMVGGLMGSRDGGITIGAELYANASVGIFDPATHSWQLAVANEQKLARAFHQAVLLPSPPDGPYRVLMTGGVMANDLANPLVARRLAVNLGLPRDFPCDDGSACRHHFSIVPHESSVTGDSGIITYDPATNTVTYETLPALPGSPFPAVALDPSGNKLFVAGGADRYSTKSATGQGFERDSPQAHWVDLELVPPGVSAATAGALRAGHSASLISDQSFLVLGGNMEGDDTAWAANFGETASQGSNLLPLSLANNLPTTGWHTLTAVGRSDATLASRTEDLLLLWTGGYLLRANAAPFSEALPSAAPSTVVRQVRISGSTLEGVETSLATPLRQIGYHQAIRLHDGAVLVSGGAYEGKCPSDNPFCPADDLAVFQRSVNKVSARVGGPSKLLVGRYGHQATRLLDNTVLFSGGFNIDGDGSPEVVMDAERASFLNGGLDRIPSWIQYQGSPLERNEMSNNDPANGACRSQNGPSQTESSIKTVTGPLSLTKSGRRIRIVRRSTLLE